MATSRLIETSHFTAESLRLLALAHALAPAYARPGVVAVLAAGSAALGMATVGSDLDLVVFDAGVSGCHEETSVIDETPVSVIRCEPDYPLDVDNPSLFLWKYREAARLAAGVAVHDPQGWFAVRRERLRRLCFTPSMAAEYTRAAKVHLAVAVRWSHDAPVKSALSLQSALMLGLCPLLHSPLVPAGHHYSKPKWETRTLRALPLAGSWEAYVKSHGLDLWSPAAARRAQQALETLRWRTADTSAVLQSAEGRLVDQRVAQFQQDADDRLRCGDVEAAAAPLRFAAFELAWLAAVRSGVDYDGASSAPALFARIGLEETFVEAAFLGWADAARVTDAARSVGEVIAGAAQATAPLYATA